jgi:zinc transport system ATP-binding protein
VKPLAFELDDVSFSFRGLPVLQNVSLRVEDGAYLAILGPNGGGKTTLLRLLLGLIEPDAGCIRVLGDSPVRARGRVGYVPQHAAFDREFPIRVLDVVRMGRRPARRGARGGDADRDAARRALEQVELADLAARPIGRLSDGELQRVLIARALVLEPRLLLLDEPTASLDERIGRSVWELLGELSRRMTVVLVSHDIGAISHYVRSVACLNRTLFAHPSRELTAEMIEATYGCPVELLAHGHPHRVLRPHEEPGETP